MKIRVKFCKHGCMKFVGHLDMMRYFQKAIRRANIDIRYSEGYSAHQIMSFAAPLGVGITSDGEYFDIDVNSTATSKESIDALNKQMVEGVKVTGYTKLPDNAKTAMSVVATADYILYFKEGYSSLHSVNEWQNIIDEYFNSKNEFVVIKKSKKSEREVDIKPLVYDFKAISYKLEDNDNVEVPAFYLKVSTGSIDNIKPEFVLASLCAAAAIPYDELAIQIHRLDIYAACDDGSLKSLLLFGEEIS